MHVLVAGSSGLIGNALVGELRQTGHRVRTLVRRTPTAETEFRWDPPAGRIPSDALTGIDAVVNLCGRSLIGRWTAARKQEIRDSRIEPTEVLSDAVAEQQVPVLVNASAVGYYGETGDEPVDEDAAQGNGFRADLCADWERATERATQAGARVSVLRTGIVLAAHGGMLQLMKPIVRLGLGGTLGDGSNYVPWISLTDQVAAIRFVLESGDSADGISGPVNLCAPRPVTNRELTTAIGEHLHRPTPWRVPRVAMTLALGEGSELAFASQRVLPRRLTEAGFGFAHEELDAALTAEL